MLKYIQIIIAVILTSFYLFPLPLGIMPNVNTKMLLAGVSLILLIFNLARHRRSEIRKDIFILSIFAAFVSLYSMATMLYNHTTDNSFVGLVVSAWVWLGGAYTLTRVIKLIHGNVTFEIVSHYVIAVCVAQCILALCIELFPAVRDFVNTIHPHTFVEEKKRWHGLGAALDTAGTRFSVALILTTFLSVTSDARNKTSMWLYILAFFIIAFLGNIVARTTTVGMMLSIFYICFLQFSSCDIVQKNSMHTYVIGGLLIVLPITIWSYFSSPMMHEAIRVGFEGFFSLFEKGYWEVDSNEILKNMVVFPNNLKTWLIGDGYCANPGFDPYYTGDAFHGFYQDTDIGYCRFLFYFGFPGLLFMAAYIIYAGYSCIQRHMEYKHAFVLLVILNFIIWCKVSTDLFWIFALFLCVTPNEGDMSQTVSER